MKIWQLMTPDTWCKGLIAVDRYNQGVEYDSPHACKWCLQGWLLKLYGDNREVVYQLEEQILQTLNLGYICFLSQWNDNGDTTFEMVRDILIKEDL